MCIRTDLRDYDNTDVHGKDKTFLGVTCFVAFLKTFSHGTPLKDFVESPLSLVSS